MATGYLSDWWARICPLGAIRPPRVRRVDRRKAEKEEQQAKAWDLWLDCKSYREIGDALGIDHKTVADWTGEFTANADNSPPASRQHFDVWQFSFHRRR